MEDLRGPRGAYPPVITKNNAKWWKSNEDLLIIKATQM